MWKYVEIWQMCFSDSNSWAKCFFFSLYITNSTLILLHSACSKLADDLEKLWLIKVFCASLSSFHTEKVFRISWSILSGAPVPIPTVQPAEMYQTSSNTFHSQQHILAEWGEQCGGYINQLSKYSTSVSHSPCVCVCLCVLQTLTSAKTGHVSTTRCVYKALAVSPACANQVTLVSCVRQVSRVFHSPGESRHLPPEEIFSAAFYIKLSHLADVFVQRVSQSV